MNKFLNTYHDFKWKMFGSGSSARVFGISVYGNPHYHKKWFQYTVMPAHDLIRSIGNGKRWIRNRTVKKYKHHIVYTDLEPGRRDVDTVMLHACFALLCRYVEWECRGVDKIEEFNSELLEEEEKDSDNIPYKGALSDQANRQSEAVTL